MERDRAMELMLDTIMKPSFTPQNPISVTFEGEDGVDAGALRSSFLELVKTRLGDLPIFIEQPDGLHLQLNYECRFSKGYMYNL